MRHFSCLTTYLGVLYTLTLALPKPPHLLDQVRDVAWLKYLGLATEKNDV